ncbi:ATP-binding cassette domain-containing protein [Paenibacillus sp. CGMCC 1.16610]|uniref:ATP-binding cassette domain-containing protein n=1 Tax=Paenibacillus anseongense TaxID=2682845 RepID=A0ABW9UHY1_9BACL|nr:MULTISPECIES: ATP-binding cassette domain-containing protein [Paenibacillus]MBA2939377.1 ATP-binding cassette domain-containing protein [Paenibacillus sp. CGMCC 1.16610]MVQ39822.1 ATP-binding cassette domain-containing protein [Paenibacillus anseongense]
MTVKAIEISGLTKAFKNGRGITELNLDVDQGDIFGFLGPNGAGKTTAMKMITGLMKPDRGDVKIFGASILADYVNAMKHVGCLIETAESYPYLTANDNLKMFARFYPHVDQKRIDECLELTGMLKYKNEKSQKFSLGMKQRLGIAAAILSKPKLLILDEPLNGLDVEGMLEMRKLIKQLSQEGTTFFISSHLIHDVELTCTRIGIIYGGKLVNVEYTQNILSYYSSLENFFVSEVDRNGRV